MVNRERARGFAAWSQHGRVGADDPMARALRLRGQSRARPTRRPALPASGARPT